MKLKRGLLDLIIASFFWGTIGIDVEYFSRFGANSFQVVFVRGLIAGLLGLLTSRSVRNNLLKKDLILMGVLTITSFYEVYIFTIGVIGADLAAVLLYTAPIWVLIFGYFLNMESISVKKSLAILLTFIGVYLISDTPTFTLFSLGLGLASGLLYALTIIHSKYLQNKGYDNVSIVSVTTLWSTPLTLIIALIIDIKFTIYSVESGVYLGIVASFLAYIFFYRGLKYVEPSIATVASALEPVFTIILAYPILHEFMTEKELIGSILIIISIFLAS
ncbi:MAG: EamA family transporter [Sulfolobus sp.]|nr:EamA family transporter [Sulfolobus sp.]